jgi:hypothetical protein
VKQAFDRCPILQVEATGIEEEEEEEEVVVVVVVVVVVR